MRRNKGKTLTSIPAPPPELQLNLDDLVGVHFPPKVEKAINEITRLYPDIDREFVGNTITDKINAPNVTDDFIMTYCDKPKKPYPKKAAGQRDGLPPPTRDYMKQCPQLSSTYRSLCKDYVFNAYPYLSESDLSKVLADHFNQLTPSLRFLEENLVFTTDEILLDDKSITPLTTNRSKIILRPEADKEFLDEAILYEIELQDTHIDRENKTTNSLMNTLKEDFHVSNIRECQHCGVQFFMEDMIVASCNNDDHYMCKPCFVKLFKNECKTLLPNLTCGNPDCKALFDLDTVEQMVSKEDFELYMKRKQSGTIAAIHNQLPSWKQCLKCMQYTPLPPGENKIFFCGNPDCHASTCMECDSDMHWGVICPNIVEKKLEDFKDYVNRAMNAKTVQKCPKPGCGTKVAKNEHCNHITCPKCGTHFCYLCGANLGTSNIYGHFGDPPKCPLNVSNTFSQQRAQDYQRAHAAGVAAAAEWRRQNPEYAYLKLPAAFEID